MLKKVALTFIAVFYLAVLGQKLYAQTNLSGTYKGFNICEIASYTITIKPNEKFEHHYSGHLLTNAIIKGTWKTTHDTLTLFVDRKEYDKFTLAGDSMCRVIDKNDLCKNFCLKKQVLK